MKGKLVGVPFGWSKVSDHLIWDVKMDLTQKSRWLLDEHKKPNLNVSMYYGVVSRESAQISPLTLP